MFAVNHHRSSGFIAGCFDTENDHNGYILPGTRPVPAFLPVQLLQTRFPFCASPIHSMNFKKRVSIFFNVCFLSML